jgi:hypothetical protein
MEGHTQTTRIAAAAMKGREGNADYDSDPFRSARSLFEHDIAVNYLDQKSSSIFDSGEKVRVERRFYGTNSK